MGLVNWDIPLTFISRVWAPFVIFRNINAIAVSLEGKQRCVVVKFTNAIIWIYVIKGEKQTPYQIRCFINIANWAIRFSLRNIIFIKYSRFRRNLEPSGRAKLLKLVEVIQNTR